MDLPDEVCTFCGFEVLPGMPCKFTVPRDMTVAVTNVALEQNFEATSGRVVLYVAVNDSQPIAIMSFIIGRVESAGIDLKFSESDRVVFTTKGLPIGVHVCGYLNGGFSLNVDNGAPKSDQE
jgi:hypothetical protein